MMAGMDDKEDLVDDITLEAMAGLTRILQNVAETDVRGILINIALRIRPCFEKVREEFDGNILLFVSERYEYIMLIAFSCAF